MQPKSERPCDSHVRSTYRARKHPGRGLTQTPTTREDRHAPTTRVTWPSATRLAAALQPTAPAERGWFSSIVASRDTRWAVRRRPARAENAQPRRNVSAHREYRCGSREESVVRHRSRCARPHRGSPSPQSKATNTCRALAKQSLPTTV